MLETRDVRKYFGGIKAVDGVSLTVDEGSIVGLIGPNGAGKTTLFSVITGAASLTGGHVLLQGSDISRNHPWEVARMGMVRTFQTPRGFPMMTVLENMLVFSANRTTGFWRNLAGGAAIATEDTDNVAEADRILASVGLDERRNDLVDELGAGELKLLEFVRPLMAQPKILLLDEPAAGVNPALLGRVIGFICELRDSGITFLIVDHNLQFIMKICDTVHAMCEGKIICSGEPGAVACDPRVIESYIGRRDEKVPA